MGTALEEGLAIPHARFERLDRPVVVFGRSEAGIEDWNSPDGKPTHFIFLALTARHSDVQCKSWRLIVRTMLQPNRERIIVPTSRRSGLRFPRSLSPSVYLNPVGAVMNGFHHLSDSDLRLFARTVPRAAVKRGLICTGAYLRRVIQCRLLCFSTELRRRLAISSGQAEAYGKQRRAEKMPMKPMSQRRQHAVNMTIKAAWTAADDVRFHRCLRRDGPAHVAIADSPAG
jgi:hypothetical protein